MYYNTYSDLYASKFAFFVYIINRLLVRNKLIVIRPYNTENTIIKSNAPHTFLWSWLMSILFYNFQHVFVHVYYTTCSCKLSALFRCYCTWKMSHTGVKSDAKCFCLNWCGPISSAILFCSLLKIPFLRKPTASNALLLIYTNLSEMVRYVGIHGQSCYKTADKTVLYSVSGNTLWNNADGPLPMRASLECG